MQEALTSGGAVLTDNFTTVAAIRHYVKTEVYLRYDAPAGEPNADINCTVTVTLPSGSAIQTKDITKAFHIAFVDEDNNWTMHEVTSATDEVATLSYPALLNLEPSVSEKITAYLWFEGEDTDCYTTAALNTKLLDTTFTYSIAD